MHEDSIIPKSTIREELVEHYVESDTRTPHRTSYASVLSDSNHTSTSAANSILKAMTNEANQFTDNSFTRSILTSTINESSIESDRAYTESRLSATAIMTAYMHSSDSLTPYRIARNSVTESVSFEDSLYTKKRMLASVIEALQTTDAGNNQRTTLSETISDQLYDSTSEAKLVLISALIDGFMLDESWAIEATRIASVVETMSNADEVMALIIKLDQNMIRERTNLSSKFMGSCDMLGLVSENGSYSQVAIAVAHIVSQLNEEIKHTSHFNAVMKRIGFTQSNMNIADGVSGHLSRTVERVSELFILADHVSYRARLVGVVHEVLTLNDMYRYPTAVGSIIAFINIKNAIDASISVNQIDVDSIRIY